MRGYWQLVHRRQQSITATSNAYDIARRPGVIAQGFAQQFDALADRVGCDDQAGPHLLHDFIERQEIGGGPRQRHQQVKGQFGQRDVLSAAPYECAANVNAQVINLKAA